MGTGWPGNHKELLQHIRDCSTEGDSACLKMQLGTGSNPGTWQTPFGLDKQSSYTSPKERGPCHGRKVATKMMRSPCFCGRNRTQPSILVTEGVAEMTKKKEKARLLNPALDASGRK